MDSGGPAPADGGASKVSFAGAALGAGTGKTQAEREKEQKYHGDHKGKEFNALDASELKILSHAFNPE